MLEPPGGENVVGNGHVPSGISGGGGDGHVPSGIFGSSRLPIAADGTFDIGGGKMGLIF